VWGDSALSVVALRDAYVDEGVDLDAGDAKANAKFDKKVKSSTTVNDDATVDIGLLVRGVMVYFYSRFLVIRDRCVTVWWEEVDCFRWRVKGLTIDLLSVVR